MNFVPPPSWGTVRTRWTYLYKGLPIESLTFENDKTIRRATVRVHDHVYPAGGSLIFRPRRETL